MAINHKPNFLTKSIAFVIIMMHITSYANGKENHTIISWIIGDSIFATVIKVLLLALAFVLAFVTINPEKEK